MVPSGKRVHTWKVIYPLVWFHLVKPLYSRSIVCPHNVPLVLFVVAVGVVLAVSRKSHVVKFSGNVSDNVILRLCHVHHEFFCLELDPLLLPIFRLVG
jgi:hypothetical protein